jgi:outer membrane lipoprotein-sorting protein
MLGGDSSGGTTAVRDGQTIEKSGSLPSVDEILARYVEAMGGEKAIKAVTSRVIKGTVDIAGVSRGGTYEKYQQAPNKLLIVSQTHPMGTTKTGFNGRTAWAWSQEGTVIVKTAADVGQFERNADFFPPLRLKDQYAKVSLAGTSQIGYREVYVLDLQPPAGALERLYLDAKTYLPVRINSSEGVSKHPVETYLDDWRAVDGIQFPFSITVSRPNLSISITVKEIRHNLPIDAKLFEPPK